MPDNADPKPRTIDERLEAINQTLELVAAMHVDNDKEFRERFAEIAKAQQQDGEHIRALVRIAEIPHERLSRLEGDPQ
jgi:predicted metallo-beta-lactamase superfamily hydrolase